MALRDDVVDLTFSQGDSSDIQPNAIGPRSPLTAQHDAEAAGLPAEAEEETATDAIDLTSSQEQQQATQHAQAAGAEVVEILDDDNPSSGATGPEAAQAAAAAAAEADTADLVCPICFDSIDTACLIGRYSSRWSRMRGTAAVPANQAVPSTSTQAEPASSIMLSCKHALHCACLVPYLLSDSSFDQQRLQYTCPQCKAEHAAQQPQRQQQQDQQQPNSQQQQGKQLGAVTLDDLRQLVAARHLTDAEEATLARQLVRCAAGATSTYSCIGCNALLTLELQPHQDSNPRAATVTCPICVTLQCCSCGVAWSEEHEGVTCAAFRAAAAPPDPESQKLLAAALPCPGEKCQQGLVKVDGCNKITCQCGIISCWNCGQRITGYDHYQDRNNPTCYGKLHSTQPPQWLPAEAAQQQREQLDAERQQQQREFAQRRQQAEEVRRQREQQRQEQRRQAEQRRRQRDQEREQMRQQRAQQREVQRQQSEQQRRHREQQREQKRQQQQQQGQGTPKRRRP